MLQVVLCEGQVSCWLFELSRNSVQPQELKKKVKCALAEREAGAEA